MHEIWGTNINNVWSVGIEPNTGGIIKKWNTNAWVTQPPKYLDNVVWGIWGDAFNNVWITSGYNILKYHPPYWTGAVNNDWNNAANWSNFTIPDATTDVLISAGSNNNLVLTGGIISCSNLIVQPGCTVEISDNTILQASGTVNINGIITGTGTLLLNGSALQTLSGDGSINNLTISNATGVILKNVNQQIEINNLILESQAKFTALSSSGLKIR